MLERGDITAESTGVAPQVAVAPPPVPTEDLQRQRAAEARQRAEEAEGAYLQEALERVFDPMTKPTPCRRSNRYSMMSRCTPFTFALLPVEAAARQLTEAFDAIEGASPLL